MQILANVLVGLVAALHAYFLVLETFLWERAPGRRLHCFDAGTARVTAPWPGTRGSTTASWRPASCGASPPATRRDSAPRSSSSSAS
ncbi:hypothetical protein GCM10010358_47300 [Streptomyces minutiscleroticus]|uniref:DUF1304 domain-containing protein n=1 Tax=Streptomyces minutiscleroticus TaxID=68238 RepID=A0A918U3W6_9ACTN|nr:hypothetical protein GCM10010358_47300 [Streptomyces minutiscleroticus]